MKEELLHYLWKFNLLITSKLNSKDNKEIVIKNVGLHNTTKPGPDFFNAQIYINGQLWAGNVEIHVKSSDWYVHQHQDDANYDSVILHVVWEHDVEIFRSNNNVITTLEIKDYISKSIIDNYNKLLGKPKKWINCEKDINKISKFKLNNWLERLYFERLEEKSSLINNLLKQNLNNWDAVLFNLLAKSFGLKINGDSFFEMSKSFDFSILRKEKHELLNIEALLFGQSNLLTSEYQDQYFKELKERYSFLKNKYQLKTYQHSIPHFFRLRPNNFPTIRLSQLATLYNKQDGLFSKLMNINTLEDYYAILQVQTSNYWETHYSFDKSSKKTIKNISKSFVDLLLINTIIPLKFIFLKHQGKLDEVSILNLIQQLKPEKNSIISKFSELKIKGINAFETQALLQLKNEYCTKNKCLSCAIGNMLLQEN